MPQNTDFQNAKSENPTTSYKNRLNSWAIARIVEDQQKVIVARFRTRSDADGYIQHLRQLVPDGYFELFFDSQTEQLSI